MNETKDMLILYASSRKKEWKKKACLHFDTKEKCILQFWIKFGFSQYIILKYKTEENLVDAAPLKLNYGDDVLHEVQHISMLLL
jgi:hypothetical protein